MIVDKPQIPTNIPFYGSMYEKSLYNHTSLKAGTCSYTLCTHPISKMHHCERHSGAKIQNGYKILSIDTYYKGKLAYPQFNG